MPRPPHDRQDPTRDLGPDDESAWPSSVTELQRRAQELAARDVRLPPEDDALSTARLRARKKQRQAASRAAREVTHRVDPSQLPDYREPLDVRAGEAIVGGVRRAGGRTLDYFRSLSGQRLWTMVAVALVGGALVGGIAAFGMRRALSDRASQPWAGAREPSVAAAPTPARELAAAPAPAGREPAPAREPPAPLPVGRTLAARSPATLIIVSEPFGADIAINGNATGLKTPDSVEGLAPGRIYKVTLTRRGYRPWAEDIEVVTGGPKHVSARLERGGKVRAHPTRRRRR